MPFTKNPDGMDEPSLKLLDDAMMKLWLEQVALGASQKGASNAVQTTILDQLRILNEPHKRHSPKKFLK